MTQQQKYTTVEPYIENILDNTCVNTSLDVFLYTFKNAIKVCMLYGPEPYLDSVIYYKKMAKEIEEALEEIIDILLKNNIHFKVDRDYYFAGGVIYLRYCKTATDIRYRIT